MITPLAGMTWADQPLIERCRHARRDDRLAVLEGLHALKHALRFDARVDQAYTPDRQALHDLAMTLAPDVASRIDALTTEVPPATFGALSPRAPETGVLAIAKRPIVDSDALMAPARTAPVVWLEEPAHLGNVGAVIRVAAAVGASAVLTSGRHDPWDPAALRGSAGLHFALPVDRLEVVPDRSGPLIAIDPDGGPLRPGDLPANAILAFGSERQGLSKACLEKADLRLALPMRPHVSSLNLATSVAAVLYAWRFAVDGR